MVNTAALLAVVWFIWEFMKDGPEFVATAIQDEIRKQDDRIEKRLSRAAGPAVDDAGHEPTAIGDLRPGQPYRR